MGGPPEELGGGETVGGPSEGVGEETGAGEALGGPAGGLGELLPDSVIVMPAPTRYSVMLQQGAV